MQMQRKKIKGFTVLELIVVLALVGILSAVAYPNFSEWNHSREVSRDVDKINSLTGNTFDWKSSATTPEFYSGITQDTGVIAQEVEALGLPGITTTRDDGTKAVRYERLIPVLIQAVKELSAKVTALEGS